MTYEHALAGALHESRQNFEEGLMYSSRKELINAVEEKRKNGEVANHPMTKPKLILASGSPRRKELLEREGIAFRVVVSDAEESAPEGLSPAEVAMHNATEKALAVARAQSPDAVVVGADTIVVLDGNIFGKPADAADARRMLGALSSKTHQVITGVCVVRNGELQTFAETTDVTFRELTPEEIDAYIATGEPLDKAGAYGIQGKGGALVHHIDGDYDNVVGLPVTRLIRALDLERGD